MKFSDRLKELRGSVSQSAFTKAFGPIPQTTYSAWERGEREPPYEMLIKIAQSVDGGVSVDWLLGLTELKRPTAVEDADKDILLRLARAESELSRFKAAFSKIVKSLKLASEAIGDLHEEECLK